MQGKKSIAKSLRNWMVALAVVPLLIMAGQGYHCAKQAVLELKTAHLRTVVEAKQLRIEDWITQRKHELQMLAVSSAFPQQEPTQNRMDTECLKACFNQTLVNNPNYESIVLYSRDWSRIADTKHSLHDDETLLPENFRQALEKHEGAVVSKPHLHEGGMIGIHIGIPLENSSDGTTEYIVAVLDLAAAVFPILQTDIDQSDTIHSYFITPDNLYLAPPEEGYQTLGQRIERPPVMPGSGSQHKPAVYQNQMSEEVVGASLPLPDLGWVLVSEARTTDAFAWLGHLKKRAAITGMVTLVLVILLAGKLSKRISQPLRHMAEVAHTISEGQYHARMEHFPGREHAEVADAFNRMLDELSRTQAKLAHAAALSAIGQLSTSIVHEMRNPLSAIKMNLHVLQKKHEDDALHKELAEIASEQVLRLEAMLTDLLQYGKKLELEIADVNFDEFAEDVLQCVRPPSDGKQVSITMHNKSQRDTLYIDREHMLRAISNLADNAVHETPDGGCVTITALDSLDEPGTTLLTISDTGPGIPDRIAERLFEPFFTTKNNGVGLGLPNVKKIVELHGGTLSFKNNPKGGAVFTIKLPGNGNHA